MSVCDECPVCTISPQFGKGLKHPCPFLLWLEDEDGGGNRYREPPDSCRHVAALKAVMENPDLTLIAADDWLRSRTI